MKSKVKTVTLVICLCFISYLVGFNSSSQPVNFIKFKYLPQHQRSNQQTSNQNPTKSINKIQGINTDDTTDNNVAKNVENGAEEVKKVIETKEETKEEPKENPVPKHSKEEATQVTVKEPKQETKEAIVEETKEEPKQEIKEELKEEPKEDIKEEPKEESKEEPNEEPKEETKEDIKEESKEESKEEPKVQPEENVENQSLQENVPVTKTILYWHKPWGDERDLTLSEECGSCHVTTDQSQINSSSTGAVVFHYNELHYDRMPKQRNPDQYYIYQTMECPALVLRASHRDLHEYDGVFNWTMTYRRDSDIYSPYNTMASVMQHIKNNNKNNNDAGISSLMKGKKRGVVWIVSNCGMTNGAKNRLKLVEEMAQAGMEIDRRGKCFPDNPPPPGVRANRGNGDQTRFMTEAKFYLAFENSHHCKDYITEKLYDNAFLVGSVPIVWGPKKEDYEAVVPPHSCIFVDDFGGNLTKLADYINYLDKNDTAYEEYLHWRKMDVKDMFGFDKSTGHCQICQLLTPSVGGNHFNVPPLRKVIKSLKDWAYGDETEECLL